MPSSRAYPGLDRSPRRNWVDRAGGLPSYIERIAKHLHYEKGMPIGRAIATAINAAKKMCATGDLNWPGLQQVNVGSRAQACRAVAQWEAMKARSGSKELVRKDGAFIELVAPELRAGPRRKALAEGKALPPSGRFPIRNLEELRKAIRAIGRAQGDKSAVRRYIMRRARELGASRLIPSHWNSDGTVSLRKTRG